MKSVTAIGCVLSMLMGSTGGASDIGSGCSLALAFALDVSSSVDDGEYAMQRAGLAEALEDPQVRELIVSRSGTVALMAYEWSGMRQQYVIAPWRPIDTDADLAGFVARLREHPRAEKGYPTAIGAAIGFGAVKLEDVSACERRVLDISGDGANNDGYAPEVAFRHFPVAGVTINGLVIESGDSEVSDYYVRNVIRGAGAFVEIALGFRDYARAMKKKLLRELQSQQFAQR